MRRTLRLALSFLLFSGSLAAQTGLLLGLGGGGDPYNLAQAGGDPEPQPGPYGFGTLWITVKGSEVQFTPLRDIVIPRRDGFWRFGADLAISKMDNARQSEIFLWAGPVDAEHKPPTLGEPDCMDFSYSQTPTWISPDYVSVAAFRSATCAHYDENSDAYVLKLDALRTPMSVDNVPESRDSMRLSVTKTLGPAAVLPAKRQARKWSADANREEPYCDGWYLAEDAWKVVRKEGRWKPVALLAQQGPGACGRESAEVPLTSPLLDRITRQKPLPISFARVKQVVPGAEDVVFSPDGDLAVVVVRSGGSPAWVIEVRKVESGGLSKPLGRFDLSRYNALGGLVTMTEWALGPHVAAWDRQMQRLPKLELKKDEASSR